MADLKPWEKYQTSDSDGPWSKYGAEQKPEDEQEEGPGLGQRLYEQNVVIPVRAARKLVPYADTIQHQVIDPVIGAFTGETADKRQADRESYDDYLRRQYPLLLDAYETGADLTSSLYKPGAVQLTEPIVNQAATHPESLGLNLETGLNTLPLAAGAALNAPRAAAKTVGFIKTKPAARESMGKYEANPYYYDAAEDAAGGEPKKAMVRGMIDNLELKKTDKSIRMQAEDDAMKSARGDRGDAQREMSLSKRDIDSQRRNVLEDARQTLKVNADDGAVAQSVVRELKGVNSNVANERNAILEAQGTTHDVYRISDMFDEAIKNVTDPNEIAALRTAQRRILEIAEETGDATAIPSRRLNEVRKYLQDQIVNWGKWMTPKERAFSRISRSINDELDDKIGGNEEIRTKLRQHTIDYNDAMDLFGDDYNIAKLKSAMADPQKRAVIERIMTNNPELTSMTDIATKVDRQSSLDEQIRRGWKPTVSAEKDLLTAEQQRKEAIAAYLAARQSKKAISAERFPLTPDNAESTLHQTMMRNEIHPKVRKEDYINRYANEVHPAGPDDFWKTYDENKVLYDLSTMDTTNGSRMVNLGKAVGTPVGGAIGYLAGDKSGMSTTLGAGAGAAAGSYFDNNASKFYRGGIKAQMAYPGVGRSISRGLAAGANSLTSRMGQDQNQSTAQGQIPLDRLAGTKYEGQMIEAMNQGKEKAALLHYMLSKRDPEYNALTSGEGKKKEQIPTPRYKGLGADLGGVIDGMSFTDSVGLDPQERGQPGFEYGDQVPQPGSIKPFSFKRLFPKFSAEGSQIKQLPKMEKFGTGLKGFGFKGYRDLNVGGDTKRYWEGEYHPSEKIAGKKFDQAYATQHPDRDSYMHHTEGAVIPAEKGGIQFGMSRGVGAVPHEHVHAQLNNLRTIHPDAEKAMDFHLRQKLKSYGANPERIDMHSKNPVEFMTSIRDALDESSTRSQLMMETDNKFAKRWPQYVEGNREYMQKLRRFWNDAASEAENMTEDDLMRIIEEYKKNN